ncbi:hypothetical protein [Mucilaginibacter antarcticus]|uniref:Lipoprotein n=1 Tax=Mucilaginibacter antarcticus TaxID=1855725 RepID=A0ABW5XU51_9SPHI
MTTKTFLISIGLVSVLLITSCKTYYIPVESFKQQLESPAAVLTKQVTTRLPYGFRETYRAMSIDFIKCFDKDGNEVSLKNSPSVEIRFTDNDNRKTVFYFDRLSLKGDTITGGQSRFISSMTKSIPLSKVKLIEIQNAKRGLKYVK